MTDDLKVKAHKAVDDAHVAAHAAYDDASVAVHNTLEGGKTDVKKRHQMMRKLRSTKTLLISKSRHTRLDQK
jgi:hypothetical protein